MIDQVRRAVMEILNKDNRGYLSPDQFNSLAELAQMDMFGIYFSEFSKHQNKLHQRLENTETSNISNQLEQIIKRFETSKPLVLNGITLKYPLPGTGTGTQSLYPRVYKISKVYSPLADISEVDAQTARTLQRIARAIPSDSNPVYHIDEQGIKIIPVPTVQNIVMDYIRLPKSPKWTYTMVGSNPSFNPSSSTYQDFELPESDMPLLVSKILQYAGVLIREADIVEIMQREEVIDKQEKA